MPWFLFVGIWIATVVVVFAGRIIFLSMVKKEEMGGVEFVWVCGIMLVLIGMLMGTLITYWGGSHVTGV